MRKVRQPLSHFRVERSKASREYKYLVQSTNVHSLMFTLCGYPEGVKIYAVPAYEGCMGYCTTTFFFWVWGKQNSKDL